MKIAMLLLAMTLSASVSAQTQSVDEVALKATTPNIPNVINSPHDVQSYVGDTTGGTSWDRPFADGTCCSGLGPVVLHQEQFTISANDTCNVRSVQNGWDGYLFLYAPSFDPLNQTVNFVAGDDDGAGGIGTSDIDGVALTAGTTYQVIMTGFQAGDAGTFTNTITCPVANVTIGAGAPFVPAAQLPTLSQNALLALGLLIGLIGFVAIRRRA
ncbi:MAG TPA: IPTL-CTERM sorting domain-containing protein [Dokdonella sp.]|uniref:IPTL-CTERM sorting domain-containing protein n=1 Tax=Dokdonella sp. TaxID=2291710 RepID=UPI002D7EDD6A|nr:IPTL-CTERM sorting domain-containing protein [Dokdonella sp.]HET9033696.1 IPTL-CTERM sorting domain-containing protein [Dokdonella sp.]